MEISIVLDTNSLFTRKHKDYTKLSYIESIQRLIDDIIIAHFGKHITICLPNIVANELLKQQIESYEIRMNEISNSKYPHFEVIIEDAYDSYLRSNFEREIKTIAAFEGVVDFKTIDYPEGSVLNQTIERALDKRPPFEGKEKKSDKGFKDVILWESLLKYKCENPTQYIVLVSNDNMLKKENSLKDEYYTRFKETLYACVWRPNNNDELFCLLGTLCNNPINETRDMRLRSKFKELFTHSNILELYKGFNIKNPLDSDESFFVTNIEALDFNFLGDYNELDGSILYFVVEIAIEMTYSDTNYIYPNWIKMIYYPEFEIYYYSSSDTFSIIGFDQPVEISQWHVDEFSLNRVNCDDT